MTSYDRGDVVLAGLPFSDLSGLKRRPAVIVSVLHPSVDVFLLRLTSQTDALLPGEFVLGNWQEAGLLFPSAIKRGLFTLEKGNLIRRLERLSETDRADLERALRLWLGL
jgi:mRNA interferase MazF